MRGAMSDVVYVDDNNFESEVLQSQVPVLVDFTAGWCGPCQRLTPIVEKFASDHLAKVKVCKVDVDEASTVVSKFGIKSVPTMLLFDKGVKVGTQVGLVSLALLNNFVLEKVGA
jgi:thioredoxin 1